MTTLMTVARRENDIEDMNEIEESVAVLNSSSTASSATHLGVSETGDVTSSLRQTYHEMGHRAGEISARNALEHVVEMDVLEQLKTNMSHLEDLHGRLKFMMAEISYLIVRS